LQESFGCAILTGVIEHIYDVQKAIKNISNLLKAGGILYLEAPDASRYIDYYIVPYYYFDSEHINHFDMHSLRNLLIANNQVRSIGIDNEIVVLK
jgi:2-polyprenyl-3-methyl-5-hydroxy-6-metoxy-1,4-benzoquinol methylase